MKISPKDYERLMGHPMPKSRPKKNKFGAIRKVYNGVSYDSTGEANYAALLDLRIKAGEILRVERQPKVELHINGVLWRSWRIDFKVFITEEKYEFHEFKGVETSDYKMKRDAFNIIYPHETLIIIKK